VVGLSWKDLNSCIDVYNCIDIYNWQNAEPKTSSPLPAAGHSPDGGGRNKAGEGVPGEDGAVEEPAAAGDVPDLPPDSGVPGEVEQNHDLQGRKDSLDIRRDSKAEGAGGKGRKGVRHEVLLSREFSRDFLKVKGKAGEGDGEAKHLLKIIEKGIAKLRKDKEVGKRVRKGLIPAYYSSKYDVTNLWKLNLDSFWRMTYTIIGTDVKLMTIVLEVLDHKKYDRRFGYHG